MTLKDSYLTLSEAAKEFGVTRQTVARWVSEDDIVGEKVGRETLILKSEVERFKGQRNMMAEAVRLVDIAVDYAKKVYGYTKSDFLEYFKFDTKTGTLFIDAHKKGESHVVIKVTMGKPEQITEINGNSFVVGRKYPILTISKHKISKAERLKLAANYEERIRREKEKNI